MKKITFLIAFFIFINANAQWIADTAVNTLVADSRGVDMKAIGTSDGKTYVVFWKSVSAPTNFELRLQILNVDGTKLLGSDGMLVSDTIPMATFTVIWSITVDDNDNLYIGATGTGSNLPAYVFKLDSSGNHLWGTGGINVGIGFQVTVLPLSAGGAIVSWRGDGTTQAEMQKYDSSGTALWPTTQPVVAGTDTTYPADMFELSNGDYVMVFHEITFQIYSELYAQRYNSDGVAQWASATHLANKGTVFNTTYSSAQDGDVIYYGFKGVTGLRFDSFLQRINPDGTLPWGINGMDFDTNETDYEQETLIAFSPGSQYVWSICTYTSSGQGQKGEYVQKFDKVTGVRQFTDTAKNLYAVGDDHNIHAGTGPLFLINDQPFFLLKSGIDNGASPTTLSAVLLDANGDFAWVEESRPVATFSANKSRIQFTKPVNNQSVALFIENKSVEDKIYAQNYLDPTLSVESVEMNHANIHFINPVSAELNIKSDVLLNEIYIYDMLGQEIYKNVNINLTELTINSQNWISGIYLMTIVTSSEMQKGIKILKR
ncbi:hypothetical protein A9Q87_04740 [Flavobacteriales bacterium 34_180_T64]|nr:hypothetical protein A9Q87_04740 [Flavobacteriales bacterium 34_180_T64]